MGIEVSGSARFGNPGSRALVDVKVVCLVELHPDLPEVNLGGTRGTFFDELDASDTRLPQETEDALYWNGVMSGMRQAYELLKGSIPKRLKFFVDVRHLEITPFPDASSPLEDVQLLGWLLGDLAGTLIASGVRQLLAWEAGNSTAGDRSALQRTAP